MHQLPLDRNFMKKTLVTLALVALTGLASAQIAAPGSSWSTLTYNPSPISGLEKNNVLLQGNIEQGLVWKQFDSGWRLNTYGAVAYSRDRNSFAYNNRVTPALGVKFQKPFDDGMVDVGLQLANQRTYRGATAGFPSSGTGIQLYVQYWTGWDLKK
jgi:hypothetical protein